MRRLQEYRVWVLSQEELEELQTYEGEYKTVSQELIDKIISTDEIIYTAWGGEQFLPCTYKYNGLQENGRSYERVFAAIDPVLNGDGGFDAGTLISFSIQPVMGDNGIETQLSIRWEEL